MIWRYRRNKRDIKKYFTVFFLIFLSAPALAATLESGPGRVSLVELYSSEGCSSCPPADDWLNSLRSDRRLWKEFVPVAFHVDYWDYLGWKDIYASPRFTQRQRAYAAEWGGDTVYTPGFVLNGREWRRQSFAAIPRSDTPAGVLQVSNSAPGSLTVTYRPQGKPESGGPWKAHLVPLGFDLRSDVQAGENAGRILVHDFVAMDHHEAALQEKDGVLTAQFKFTPTKERAVVAWVTRGDSLEPVQSVGGYLDPS